MVNVFEFPDDEPPLVFVETDYSIEEVSKPESVAGYIQSFERVRRRARTRGHHGVPRQPCEANGVTDG